MNRAKWFRLIPEAAEGSYLTGEAPIRHKAVFLLMDKRLHTAGLYARDGLVLFQLSFWCVCVCVCIIVP